MSAAKSKEGRSDSRTGQSALHAVEQAVRHLRGARDLLKEAHAPKALGRVRLAITSAEGAVRNAECRVVRHGSNGAEGKGE